MQLFKRAVNLIIKWCGDEEDWQESAKVSQLLVDRMRLGGKEGEQAHQLLKDLWKIQESSLSC